ncbi:unnamed protein product [Closterium sp. Naga37s-1]|nr:unnamed protein product [Closterium sp. Naga37s-1]
MGGTGVLAVLISLYVLVEAARVLASVWISVWTGSVSQEEGGGHGSLYFVAVYSLISLGQVLLTFANQYFLVFSSQRAARRLHDAMLAAILRAPMSFFHTNPVGRLINRFTKDTADIDKNLAQYTSLCLGGIFQLLSTFALIGVLNTVALWAIVPLLLLFYVVYLYFQSTAREVKRWDSVTRSPVYSQFAEALNGLATIRAYGAAQRMAAMNGHHPPHHPAPIRAHGTAQRMAAMNGHHPPPRTHKGARGSTAHGGDQWAPPHPPLPPPTPPPSNSQFAEALNGLATIRAYRAAQRMAGMNGHAVDRNTRFTLVSMSANRWLAIRLEFLGGLMIFGSRPVIAGCYWTCCRGHYPFWAGDQAVPVVAVVSWGSFCLSKSHSSSHPALAPATAVFAVMDVQRAGDQAALAPVMATAVFAVMDVQRAGDQAALAPVMGLILVYALQITAMMTMVLRLLSLAGKPLLPGDETSFNAVERVGSYADIPAEAPAIIPSHRPPPGWPQQGEVLFEDVVMRYRPDLLPVLRGLSALVQGGEKVGVVGRTGAGKSSLFNSLFRLAEIESGHICIDGQDLKLFGVTDVRRALMIIPQTPVLFTGTLRFNLDPFSERSDGEVWEALGRAHLREVVSRMPLGLDTEVAEGGNNSSVAEGGENFSVGQRQLISLAWALVVGFGMARVDKSLLARALLKESRILVLPFPQSDLTPIILCFLLPHMQVAEGGENFSVAEGGENFSVAEGGENFSVGQRQLISLARALLKESRILVLDEATAAVDVGTDALIQRTVREEFKGRTMLTIAHRLNTIMDSDRILVMDAGMYDTPANLVLNETSTFAAMVRHTGPQTAKYSHSSPLLHPTQALEYDTPANMVLNEASVFAAMVCSTGPQTAKYLRSVALGEVALADELAGRAAAQEKQMAREAAKWRWATAAQWALALTLTSSQRDLQAMCNNSEGEEGESDAQQPIFQRGVLEETRDAAQVLQAVLSGQCSEEISSALTRRQLSEDKWWTAVSRVVQGLALMAKQVQAKLEVNCLALMAKQVQAKLEADGSLRDSASSAGAAAGGRWAQLAATGEEMAGGRVPGGGTWVCLPGSYWGGDGGSKEGVTGRREGLLHCAWGQSGVCESS